MQIKSVCMYHDENNEDLSKCFVWTSSVKNKMIVNVVDTGISSRDRINKQEYQKHNNTMFSSRMIPDMCGELATIVKNYYTHKENNPDTKIPYVKNHSIHLGRDNFKIEDGVFSFTVIPYGSRTYIKLCQYMIDMLKKYEIRSATITPTKLIITYCQTGDPDVQKLQKSDGKKFRKTQKRSKQKSVKKLPGKTVSIRDKKFTEYCADRNALKKTITVPKRKSSKTKKEQDRDAVKSLGRIVAFDRNFRSLDGYDINGNIIKYDTSEILDIWNWVRSIMSKFNRKDRRMMKKISRKYNKLGRDRIIAIINRITRDIADNCDVVILEDLTKLHELWNKKKGKGSDANFNGKNWMYGEFSRQIEYKMKWSGKVVIYINPFETSKRCSKCDTEMCVEGYRNMRCNKCNTVVDRDINASENILDKGVRFALACFINEMDHLYDEFYQLKQLLVEQNTR